MAYSILYILASFVAKCAMKICTTRMHSSRMRTGRSLTVCCSLLPGGGSLLGPGGCLPGSGGVLLGPGGLPGKNPGGGLPGPGGCLPAGGGSAWSRGGSPETPTVYRITDTCQNITLATISLRPVNISQMAPELFGFHV